MDLSKKIINDTMNTGFIISFLFFGLPITSSSDFPTSSPSNESAPSVGLFSSRIFILNTVPSFKPSSLSLSPSLRPSLIPSQIFTSVPSINPGLNLPIKEFKCNKENTKEETIILSRNDKVNLDSRKGYEVLQFEGNKKLSKCNKKKAEVIGEETDVKVKNDLYFACYNKNKEECTGKLIVKMKSSSPSVKPSSLSLSPSLSPSLIPSKIFTSIPSINPILNPSIKQFKCNKANTQEETIILSRNDKVNLDPRKGYEILQFEGNKKLSKCNKKKAEVIGEETDVQYFLKY